jgi:hypothetical protein
MRKKVSKPKAPKPSLKKTISDKAPRIPDPETEWKLSTIGMTDLEILVLEGMLQSKDEIQWNSCFGQDWPLKAKEDLVLFKSFCERGFAEPASEFVQELLDCYQLELHHLTPSGISHMAIFTHFFEAFLGIEPSVDYFRYIFHVKPQPNRQAP